MATADVTIIDLHSYTRIGIVEDNSWEGIMILNVDSTAQLVAESIAITQRNDAMRGQKRDASGNEKSGTTNNSDIVFGVKVTGSVFHFYAIQVSDFTKFTSQCLIKLQPLLKPLYIDTSRLMD